MTIKELATGLNVSPQAVYKRLNRENIKPQQLKQGDQLTPEGVETIKQLFNQQSTNSTESTNQTTESTELKELREKVEKLTTEVESLKAQLQEAKEQRDKWQEEASTAHQLALQAQQLNAAAMKQLALPPAASERQGLFQKLFGRKKAE